MLFDSELAKAFWGEAMVTAAYLVNRCPSSAIECKTPEEKWSSRPPDLNHLRVLAALHMFIKVKVNWNQEPSNACSLAIRKVQKGIDCG